MSKHQSTKHWNEKMYTKILYKQEIPIISKQYKMYYIVQHNMN